MKKTAVVEVSKFADRGQAMGLGPASPYIRLIAQRADNTSAAILRVSDYRAGVVI
jgi:hypothetical protein